MTPVHSIQCVDGPISLEGYLVDGTKNFNSLYSNPKPSILSKCMHALTRIYIHVHTRTCVHTCMFVCIFACFYIYMHIHPP